MNERNISSLGIDISKGYLDIHHLPTQITNRYPNNVEGVEALIQWIKTHSASYIVFEASGGYERILKKLLDANHLPYSMVNAGRIRHFAKAKGLLAKTDSIDSRVLADYGLTINPAPSLKSSSSLQELREWLKYRRQVIDALCLNHQYLEHKPPQDIEILIQQTIKTLEAQKELIDNKIQLHIKQSRDLEAKKNCLVQEKGIGHLTAAILIAELPELGIFSHQQISALVGVAPYNQDSGHLKGPRFIKGGRKLVRSTLYMATLSAIRANSKIRTFYLRLRANGKKAKVAVTACIHKFLIILNAIMRNAYKQNLISQ
jgi:transposase